MRVKVSGETNSRDKGKWISQKYEESFIFIENVDRGVISVCDANVIIKSIIHYVTRHRSASLKRKLFFCHIVVFFLFRARHVPTGHSWRSCIRNRATRPQAINVRKTNCARACASFPWPRDVSRGRPDDRLDFLPSDRNRTPPSCRP